MPVKFFHEKKTRVKHSKALKSFIVSIFNKEAKELDSLTYIFCSDNYLLAINRQYLQHDFYTDIISFNLSDHPENPVIGEIYISIDRVRDNACIHHTTIEQELYRVIFHGALHLCGYKDKTKAQAKEMRAKEDFYLSKYGYS